jgi:hypothetical protein
VQHKIFCFRALFWFWCHRSTVQQGKCTRTQKPRRLFCDKFKVSGAALLGRLFAALNFDSIEDLIGIRNLKNIESCDCGYLYVTNADISININ